jgi:hypothetical protein
MRNRVFILTIAAVSIWAQIEPTVLLRGIIRDGDKPAKVELLFRDEHGKTIRAKSASDGSYQTVLSPGHTYSLTITTDNLERYTYTYTVPPMTKYTELTQDFSIGATIANTSNASPQQTTPSTNKRSKVKKSKQRK